MEHLDPDLRALQEVRDFVERAKRAQETISHWSQAQVDALCKAMAEAGAAAAYDLARIAVEETGIGRVHYKVLKNLFGSRGIWESIASEKTVGIIARDEKRGVMEVATPIGVIAGIIPTTNPTSTALGKALIAVKGRNAIVISPHPRSKRCIGETVEVLRRAIERAGGPPDLVLSLTNPTIESTGALMKHRKVSLILSTGGAGLVQAAYSSGKPAYGVGPGNVPAYVDRSADVANAARSLVTSQSFDNGTLCCSEQAIVADRPIWDRLLAELKRRGAHLCSEEETAKLGKHCNQRGHMNPDVVGLDPWRIAEQAGFRVPRETSLLLAFQGGVGKEWPLSIEILCPLLSVHLVDGWQEGCKVSMQLLEYGGLGHTCGVHARDEKVLESWFLEKPASRIIVNGPTAQGAVGYSTGLMPSMSLGCGPQAGNITSDNITARHMLNIKRVAWPRRDWDSLEKRDHEWAAKQTHDAAPRGSGLDGDPALDQPSLPARSSALREETGSNWDGNPISAASPRFEKARAASAPKFVAPQAKAAPASRPAAAVVSAPASSAGTFTADGPRSAAKASAPYVGSALSVEEMQTILSHAGSGCPLGPCRGCPHHAVDTGTCTA